MKKEFGGNEGLRKKIFLCPFLLMVLCSTTVFASVAGKVNKANSLYKQGQLNDSLKLYQEALDQDAKSSVVNYDLGTAFYKKGDYAKALDYLEQAAQDKNVKIKSKAEYNLGNVLFKSGMQKKDANVDEAIKSLQEALGHYGESLTVAPKDQDAQFNQDFVKKEIERLKLEKEQQKQQNQQQQNQQQQNQKQEQQKQQNQQDQKNQQGQQRQEKEQKQQEKQQESQQAQQNKSKDQKKEEGSSQSQAQKQQKAAQDQAEQSQKELDRKQAEDLLEDYHDNEEPKKFLNYMPKKIDDRPVLKDW